MLESWGWEYLIFFFSAFSAFSAVRRTEVRSQNTRLRNYLSTEAISLKLQRRGISIGGGNLKLNPNDFNDSNDQGYEIVSVLTHP